MKALKERLENARLIARELSRQSLSHSVLGDRAAMKGVSHAVFESLFSFLVDDGDIEKCGVAHLAPFRLTDKGKAFLVWRVCGE